MKKVLRFWWVLLILAPVIFISSMVVSAKNSESDRRLSKEYADKLLIPPEGNYNAYILEGVKDRLGLVPSRYLRLLYDKNIFIRAVNGSVTSVPEFTTNKPLQEYKVKYEDYGGVFIYNSVIVRVDEKYKESTEIHEVGHAVDSRLFDNISSTDRFKEIFDKEGVQFFNKARDEYYLQNSIEYFAEVFNYYYYGYDSRKYLKERAPLTYKFIKELESRKIS